MGKWSNFCSAYDPNKAPDHMAHLYCLVQVFPTLLSSRSGNDAGFCGPNHTTIDPDLIVVDPNNNSPMCLFPPNRAGYPLRHGWSHSLHPLTLKTLFRVTTGIITNLRKSGHRSNHGCRSFTCISPVSMGLINSYPTVLSAGIGCSVWLVLVSSLSVSCK